MTVYLLWTHWFLSGLLL